MADDGNSTINELASAGFPVPTKRPDPGSLTEAELDGGVRKTVNALKAIRTSRNMTIAQVAGFMGVDKSVVSKFESGPADPRLSTLLRYAHAVGATMLAFPTSETGTSLLDGFGDRLHRPLQLSDRAVSAANP